MKISHSALSVGLNAAAIGCLANIGLFVPTFVNTPVGAYVRPMAWAALALLIAFCTFVVGTSLSVWDIVRALRGSAAGTARGKLSILAGVAGLVLSFAALFVPTGLLWMAALVKHWVVED
jgi:hypothetical protein